MESPAPSAALEEALSGEILRMYQEIVEDPDAEFHFFHGREAAERFGYDPAELDTVPAGALASFAGVGNPHERADLQPGETVLDLGSGAGLDAVLASRRVGPAGRVIGVDMNPVMCLTAEATWPVMEDPWSATRRAWRSCPSPTPRSMS